MANNNTEKKQQAQFLYMAGGKTQKEIADLVGVSERTVYAWIHQYAWDKLRLAAFQAPATIADNLCSQIVELQNAIAAREPGKRYPSPEEAEVMRKLITAWERTKKHPSLSVHLQVLETFRNYIRPVNKEFAASLGRYTERYIEAKSVNGYAPYQVEYGVEPVSPVLPCYDEVEGLDENEPAPIDVCPGLSSCAHMGDCTYPKCQRLQSRNITIADYKVTPVQYMRVNVQQQPPAVAAEATGSIPATTEGEMDSKIHQPLPATAAEVTGSNSAVFTSGNTINESAVVPQKADEDKRNDSRRAA